MSVFTPNLTKLFGMAWPNARELAPIAAAIFLLVTALITLPAAAASLPEQPGDRAIGSDDAQITMIEYYSLDCPHCATFHRDVFPQLKAQFIRTGKVRFVYRDFPLSWGALEAAVMTHCAPPERFFAVQDALLKNIGAWAKALPTVRAIAEIGAAEGVTSAQYQSCLDERVWERQIFESQKFARETLGVTATPTFFINGDKLVGNMAFEHLSEGLHHMLNEINGQGGDFINLSAPSVVAINAAQ